MAQSLLRARRAHHRKSNRLRTALAAILFGSLIAALSLANVGAASATSDAEYTHHPAGFDLDCDAATFDLGRDLTSGDHINMDVQIGDGPVGQVNAYVDQNIDGGHLGLGLRINGHPSIPLTEEQVETGRIHFEYSTYLASETFTVQWVQFNSTYFNQDRVAAQFLHCGELPTLTPECVDDVTWWYEWNGPLGSGTVTAVGGEQGAPVCDPLYVRASTWTYDEPVTPDASVSWSQSLLGYNDYTIATIGTHPFETPGADCAQDDVYASFAGFDALELPSTLHSPQNPWEPDFLHEVVTQGIGGRTWASDPTSECFEEEQEPEVATGSFEFRPEDCDIVAAAVILHAGDGVRYELRRDGVLIDDDAAPGEHPADVGSTYRVTIVPLDGRVLADGVLATAEHAFVDAAGCELETHPLVSGDVIVAHEDCAGTFNSFSIVEREGIEYTLTIDGVTSPIAPGVYENPAAGVPHIVNATAIAPDYGLDWEQPSEWTFEFDTDDDGCLPTLAVTGGGALDGVALALVLGSLLIGIAMVATPRTAGRPRGAGDADAK